MAAVAFMGAFRSVRNWQTSARRPARAVMMVQVALQVLLGLACVIFGLWFMLFGE